MAGLKKRYANVAVEVKRTEEEGEWERERERESEGGEGVLVGGEGQTEQEAVNEQRDFDAILQAFEEAPVKLDQSTTTSSLSESEDAQPLASSASTSTPPSSPSPSTETSSSIPPSTPTPIQSSTTSKRALRKEKLLELARQNAQQPLPEALKARELDSQVLSEEEKEKETKGGKGEKQAVRERLWRLMGGLLP